MIEEQRKIALSMLAVKEARHKLRLRRQYHEGGGDDSPSDWDEWRVANLERGMALPCTPEEHQFYERTVEQAFAAGGAVEIRKVREDLTRRSEGPIKGTERTRTNAILQRDMIRRTFDEVVSKNSEIPPSYKGWYVEQTLMITGRKRGKKPGSRAVKDIKTVRTALEAYGPYRDLSM